MEDREISDTEPGGGCSRNTLTLSLFLMRSCRVLLSAGWNWRQTYLSLTAPLSRLSSRGNSKLLEWRENYDRVAMINHLANTYTLGPWENIIFNEI